MSRKITRNSAEQWNKTNGNKTDLYFRRREKIDVSGNWKRKFHFSREQEAKRSELGHIKLMGFLISPDNMSIHRTNLFHLAARNRRYFSHPMGSYAFTAEESPSCRVDCPMSSNDENGRSTDT
jgi:hypothetical protein